MSLARKFPGWSVLVNAKVVRAVGADADAAAVATMFGLPPARTDSLYDDFALSFAPGEIVAVIGPSGAGKTVLLRQIAEQVPAAGWLDLAGRLDRDRSVASTLSGGCLRDRLAMLSRCGLAEAALLAGSARHLSGGEAYRLALAEALHAAAACPRPGVVLADEFASCLDPLTAAALCRRVRKLITGSHVALVLATPRPELVPLLRPDTVIVKAMGTAPRVVQPDWSRRRLPAAWDLRRWPITRGDIHDYHALAAFHYVAKPPAAHKRVYVIRPPRSARRTWLTAGAGDPAAVLVVSPPLMAVRGRNIATAGRYAGGDRAAAIDLLNREVECISRVVVHPMYRGCGLAVRLVRHALADARTPLMEALASMGAVHPLFERAGMTAHEVPPPVRRAARRATSRPYVYYLAPTARAGGTAAVSKTA
jgi:ABC-type nitrate/sulfonate/bicarbonate transport system ATPase subunit/predicted GNAT family acetyltransferase